MMTPMLILRSHLVLLCALCRLVVVCNSYEIQTDVSYILSLSQDVLKISASSDAITRLAIYESGLQTHLAGNQSSIWTLLQESRLLKIRSATFQSLLYEILAEETATYDTLSLALHLFGVRLEVADELFNVLTSFRVGNLQAALQSLDASAAWFYGDDCCDSTVGYMLYSQTQPHVNEQINQQLLSLQLLLVNTTDNEISMVYPNVRAEVKEFIQTLDLVVLDSFSRHWFDQQYDLLRIDTLAALPQLVHCNPDAVSALLRQSVTDTATAANRDSVFLRMMQSLQCFGLSCEQLPETVVGDCREAQAGFLPRSLATYQPSSDVRTGLDGDFAAVETLLRENRWEAAGDFLQYGWYATTTSWAQLAEQSIGEVAELYDDFFQTETPWSSLQSALKGTEEFVGATDAQRQTFVLAFLKGHVAHRGVNVQLDASYKACLRQIRLETQERWDEAVGIYVEGMLYGLTVEVCNLFGTCDGALGTYNRALSLFEQGRDLFDEAAAQCSRLRLLISEIRTVLLAPLVQATIRSAVAVDERDEIAKSSLAAYSRAVVPSFFDANSEDASLILANTNYFFNRSVSLDLFELSSSLCAVILDSDLDCESVGSYSITENVEFGVCPETKLVSPPPVIIQPTVMQATPSLPPSLFDENIPTKLPVATFVSDQPTMLKPLYIPEERESGLAWGRYNFTNEKISERDVEFSTQVKLMHDSTSVDRLKDVYSARIPYPLTQTSDVQSLADLSLRASDYMLQDPEYNFFRLALYGESLESDDYWSYGDEIVMLAIDNANDPAFASQAVLILNVWMFLVQRFHAAVRLCSTGQSPMDLIDSAVTLWIGSEQDEGSFGDGWMLYSLAQEAFRNFGQPESEAPVNSEIIDLFVVFQQMAKACPMNTDITSQLRMQTLEVVRKMTAPLVQQWLYYIATEDMAAIQLYSLAIFPLAVACDRQVYENLKTFFVENFVSKEVEGRLGEIAEFLNCLKLTCSDIGDLSLAKEELRQLSQQICEHLQSHTLLEGRSLVASWALIDLDIRQVRIFARANAMDLAWSTFRDGRNSDMSLQALSKDRFIQDDATDVFEVYEQYFGIEHVLSSSMQNLLFSTLSDKVISERVFRTLQTTLSFQVIIGKLRDAINQCIFGSDGVEQIREAESVFVGSQAGLIMLYGLAIEVCMAFEECPSGNSQVNGWVLQSLTELKRQVQRDECTTAEELLDRTIIPLLQLILVEATIYMTEERRLGSELAVGGISVADSILPFVAKYNESASERIRAGLRAGSTMSVVAAFASVLDDLGIDCSWVHGPHSPCNVDAWYTTIAPTVLPTLSPATTSTAPEISPLTSSPVTTRIVPASSGFVILARPMISCLAMVYEWVPLL